jgi:hypothetical protein
MNKWLIAAGVGVVLIYNRVNSIIKAVEASTILVSGGRFVKLESIQQSHIVVRLSVNNPTSTTFSLGGFKGSLTYQGNTIATIDYYGSNDVIRPGITTIDIPAIIDNETTVQSAWQLLQALFNGDFRYAVKLTGTFVKYGYRLPVDETFTLKDFL